MKCHPSLVTAHACFAAWILTITLFRYFSSIVIIKHWLGCNLKIVRSFVSRNNNYISTDHSQGWSSDRRVIDVWGTRLAVFLRYALDNMICMLRYILPKARKKHVHVSWFKGWVTRSYVCIRFLLRFKEVTDASQHFYELKQCRRKNRILESGRVNLDTMIIQRFLYTIKYY